MDNFEKQMKPHFSCFLNSLIYYCCCLFSCAIYQDVVLITVKASVLLRSLKRELLVLSIFLPH